MHERCLGDIKSSFDVSNLLKIVITKCEIHI